MKKITSILAFSLVLSWMSCTPESINSINEINDFYTVPADAVELTTLVAAESTWSLDRRYFDLSFSGGGSTLETRLVGFDALLSPGQYLLGSDEIGKAVVENTKLNGKSIQNGYILVTKKDTQYQITAKSGDEVLLWKGVLPFEEDPAPLQLTEVLQAQSNKSNGVNSLTMQLATAGIHQEFDMTTYQQVWVGEGKYLALDIYSEDGYLHDGNYMACAEGGVIGAGEFGIGYDTEIQWGDQVYPVYNWGTCLWTVADGAATAEKISGGMVSVSSREETVDDKDVTIWTIFWGEEYPKELLFEGAIPALTKPKPIAKDPDYLYTDVVTEGDVDTHAITITDKGGNVVAYVEILTEKGATDLSGSYPSTSYASQPGQMRDGYEGGSWGEYTWPGGGSYYVDEGGEQHYMLAGTATLIVTPIATGAYNFACEFFNYNAAGPDYVPVSGGGTVYDMTDTVAADCTDSNNTLYENVESHTLVMKEGEQLVAQIKLVRSVGTTDLSGTYTVGEYAHEDMVAANGFDLGAAMFGMDPGSWVIGSYYIKDGSVVIIEPGETITVTSVGAGTYKFDGSTGYSFSGKLQ